MIFVYYYIISSVITFAKYFMQAHNIISYYIIAQKLLHCKYMQDFHYGMSQLLHYWPITH